MRNMRKALRCIKWRNIVAIVVLVAIAVIGLRQRDAIGEQVRKVRELLPEKLEELRGWAQARGGNEDLLLLTATPATTPLAPGRPCIGGGYSWFATLEPTPTATPTIHIVQPGETLASIAKRYGVTVETIVEANDLTNPDVIEVGQELIIPVN